MSKIKRIHFYLLKSPFKKGKFLAKNNILNSCGERVFYYPRHLPNRPQLLKIGNNVTIAANVTFIDHDVMSLVFNDISFESTELYLAPIEIGNNVFIGANTIILPNVKIGNNCIIGAGSIVTKDIEDNSIAGGNPAKKISEFNKLHKIRKELMKHRKETGRINSEEYAWELFYNKRK